ncbi:MAG: hypothetical protein E6Q59_01880 [Nitrosomonas sp.]|nr:MAG: hypothetical protein E6Q59_01880 [Nitrosomonas sp.]
MAMEKLQIDKLLGEENGKDRNLKLVKAMIICDVLELEPRHALIRDYADTTLGQSLGLENIEEKELHDAMDWLYQRQPAIEKQLAQRHLLKSSRIITCLSNCYLNDDLEVNFRLITDDQGCPVSIYTYPSRKLINIKTFKDHLGQLLEKPDLQSVILVGDRIKIPQKMIDKLSDPKDMNWIAGIKTESLLDLFDGTNLKPESLFDSYDLVEIPHTDYPEEKFIVWRNPDRKNLRKKERDDLLNSTMQSLEEIKELVNQGKLRKAETIRLRVNRILRGNVLKSYFSIKIENLKFEYTVDHEQLNSRESLDGVFAIRTSLVKDLSPLEIRNLYRKTLVGMAKRDFYYIDGINPRTHPMFTYDKIETNKYLFMRLLATHVEWQMRKSWNSLIMFIEHDSQSDNPDQETAAAENNQLTEPKKQFRIPLSDLSVHSFRSLLQHLATITRNTCRKTNEGANASPFLVDCKLNPSQQRAFNLLKKIRVYR